MNFCRASATAFLIIAVFVAAQTAVAPAEAQEVGSYEGRLVAAVEVAFENSPPDPSAEAEFLSLLSVAPNTEYSAVRARDSLDALFYSNRVASARVEVREEVAAGVGSSPASGAGGGGPAPVRVRFVVRRLARIGGPVVLALNAPIGAPISEDELRARLNMLETGARASEQTLDSNADLIQAYLRDRGFFKAEVEPVLQLDPTGTRATVTFRINAGEQARVGNFNINITGFDPSRIRPTLRLQSEAPFTQQALGEDTNRIRQALIALDRLAPQLEDPRIAFNSESNRVDVSLTGEVGPKVTVTIKNYEPGEKKERELLPIKREGSLDLSAIEEGRRRLQNELQEDGYFFTEVTPVCTVTPATPAITLSGTIANGTREMCENLAPSELGGSTVNVTYDVEQGRRFKLTDIRIEGTDKITYEDVKEELRSQEANALGFIPLLGYGRGYTSQELLERDRRTIEAVMRDLGYRGARATVRQGVSIDGENLIITFVVDEGPLTRIAGAEIRGNQIYTEARLRDELKVEAGAPFSRSEARAAGDRILGLYARDGYFDAQLDFSFVELPAKTLPDGKREEQVRLVYTIRNEGDKVFIDQIIVNGNLLTDRQAILDSLTLKEGEVLRAEKLAESERLLYATDAFRQVIIRTEPAGETASGFKKRDVVIDVEELKPRILSYGGGYSTDNGPLGSVDIRNVNLFGRLRQGGARVRVSRRQQVARLEYFDPRFRRYGDDQFAPLALSLQYQRDSNITRFFRSTIDRGNSGIVQRLDEDGNPIDEFGNPTGEPTINRFTFTAETQRLLDRDTRSIFFLRYSYEDVRLYDIDSLLVADILRPDRSVRLSRIGATFVRDTRERCGADNRLRLFGGAAARRAAGNRETCQYSQTDATDGDFLSLDYGLALRQLGGNISFNKFQGTYRRFHKFDRLRGTVVAGNITVGLANIFNPRDRGGDGAVDAVDLFLPISERFFSGGSTTLRGFNYEEAGPRVVVCPGSEDSVVNPVAPPAGGCKGGVFRNSNGELVTLDPFTVPVGGNALAVVNLEARIPFRKAFQVVPFYDGGNVFRRVGDIFGRDAQPGEDPNLNARWAHTVGLGLRVKTPIGGALAVDYGFLINPPEFLIPQAVGPNAIFRIKRTQLHFRFTQAF